MQKYQTFTTQRKINTIWFIKTNFRNKIHRLKQQYRKIRNKLFRISPGILQTITFYMYKTICKVEPHNTYGTLFNLFFCNKSLTGSSL